MFILFCQTLATLRLVLFRQFLIHNLITNSKEIEVWTAVVATVIL